MTQSDTPPIQRSSPPEPRTESERAVLVLVETAKLAYPDRDWEPWARAVIGSVVREAAAPSEPPRSGYDTAYLATANDPDWAAPSEPPRPLVDRDFSNPDGSPGHYAPEGQSLDVDAIYEALWAERDRLDAGIGGFNEALYRRAARAIVARLSESSERPTEAE